MNTIEPMLSPSPLGWEPMAVAPRRRWLLWFIPVTVVIVALIMSAFITLPYYAIIPGSARGVSQLINVPTDKRFPPKGDFLLTTVTLRRVRPLDAVRGWLDKDIEVVPAEQILGTTKPKDYRQQNFELMDDSKQVAAVVALRKIGLTVTEHGEGALIRALDPESPAADRLEAGEVITAVEGRSTLTNDDAVAALGGRKPGEIVHVEIDGGSGKPRRIEEFKLGARSADGARCFADQAPTARGCLGVSLITRGRRFDPPPGFDVKIDSAGIGGPSAGLAFALGTIDALTKGELTGGRDVAVTGTIEIGGQVGPVGGVVQKTAAVRRQGVEVFLVPPEEYEEAKAHAGKHLQVVKVANIDEAIAALGRLGGDTTALGVRGQG